MSLAVSNDSPDRPAQPRVGFTVPKALGKSVVRSLIRRRTREAVRLEYASIGARWDIVLHPRRSILEAPFEELRDDVRRLIQRAGAKVPDARGQSR